MNTEEKSDFSMILSWKISFRPDTAPTFLKIWIMIRTFFNAEPNHFKKRIRIRTSFLNDANAPVTK